MIPGMEMAALAAAGWVAYQCRGLVSWVARCVRRQFTTMLFVSDDNDMFKPMLAWVSKRCDTFRDIQPNEASATMAPGVTWFWHDGRPVWFQYYRNDAPTGGRTKATEELWIQFWRPRQIVESVIAEAHREYEQQGGINVFPVSSFGACNDQIKAIPRSISTVYLPEIVRSSIVSDAKNFFASETEYVSRGVPYRRGYLLYGIPGSGKTSLAFALASELSARIYVISLKDMREDGLQHFAITHKKGSIILFEDVDCVSPTREEKSGLPLSALLNFVDGILSPRGCLFIFTTNHPEKLDPALTREGRMDLKIEFGPIQYEQALEMCNRISPEGYDPELPRKAADESWTPAKLQEELLRARNFHNCV